MIQTRCAEFNNIVPGHTVCGIFAALIPELTAAIIYDTIAICIKATERLMVIL